MKSRKEEHFERHAGYPPDGFEEVWIGLKEELNLTEEDLIMASAVIGYTRGLNGGTDVICKHMITGKPVTMNLPIDATQLLEWECNKGVLVQHAFPHLTAAQREFLMTGLSDDEWSDVTNYDPEEDE